jgi:TonB family protein
VLGRIIWIGFAAALIFPALTLAQQSIPPNADNPSSTHQEPAPSEATPIPRMPIEGDLMVKDLLKKVPPEYPAEALAAKISGTVVFHAILATNGSVKEVQVVSGPPQLVAAATNAVKQWKYRTFTLNGQPAEIDTTISVVFSLADPAGTGKIIDPQLRADIVHMYYSMRGFDAAEQTFEDEFNRVRRELVEASPSLDPNQQQIMQAYTRGFFTTIRLPAFVDGIVAIYAKHFTDEKIKAIDQFYQSPVGQRFALQSPDVNAENTTLGRKFATDHIPGVLAELCEEFPELQSDEKLCPSAPTGSQSRLMSPSRPNLPSLNPVIRRDN